MKRFTLAFVFKSGEPVGLLRSLNAVAEYLGRVAARLLGFSRSSGSAPVAAVSQNGPAPLLDPASETLQWLRERFAEDVKRNFTNSHDPDGNRWAPLKWRIGKPLILTGLLMNSAYTAARNVTLRNGTEIFARLSEPHYWKYHEYGTRRIPARPFFGPSADTVQELAERMARDAAERVGE